MGYTNHWEVRRDTDPARLAATVPAVAAIAREESSLLAGWDGVGRPDITDDHVVFNGRGADSHETFAWPPDLNEEQPWLAAAGALFPPTSVYHFCKTDAKPYDRVVVACLLAAKSVLGPSMTISSDGGDEALNDEHALDLVRSIVGIGALTPGELFRFPGFPAELAVIEQHPNSTAYAPPNDPHNSHLAPRDLRVRRLYGAVSFVPAGVTA